VVSERQLRRIWAATPKGSLFVPDEGVLRPELEELAFLMNAKREYNRMIRKRWHTEADQIRSFIRRAFGVDITAKL
jgi:hypothetical protein